MNMSRPLFSPTHFTYRPSFYQWRPSQPRSCSTGTCTAPHCLPHKRWVSTHGWRWIVTCRGKKSVAVGNEATKNNASETCLVISTFVTAAWPKCCFWPPTTRDEMSRTKDPHGRIGRGTGYRPADPEVVETRTEVEFGWKWQEMTRRVLCTFIVRVW